MALRISPHRQWRAPTFRRQTTYDSTSRATPVTDSHNTAAVTTLLGQLQRGRGDGFREAISSGRAAHDALLRCIVDDPRHDHQDEARERYYAELVVELDLSPEPIVEHLHGQESALGHGVLAGAWRLGHAPTRRLLTRPRTDKWLVEGIALQLWNFGWARLVELDGVAKHAFLRAAVQGAFCVEAARRQLNEPLAQNKSLDDLLELGRQMPKKQQWAIVEELCRRGTEEDREFLEQVVQQDFVYARVMLAAQALGTLGDERLLPTIEEQFAQEDVLDDPLRRLQAHDRMRRSALSEYVKHLPPDRQLELARSWHGRGAFFSTMASDIYGTRATPDDRETIEAAIEQAGADCIGHEILNKLIALGRIGDPRSAPLLLQVVEQAVFSTARQRALQALAGMPQVAGVQAAIRESLWDCEDAAVAGACGGLVVLDNDATQRIRNLADCPLLDEVSREHASIRLADKQQSI